MCPTDFVVRYATSLRIFARYSLQKGWMTNVTGRRVSIPWCCSGAGLAIVYCNLPLLVRLHNHTILTTLYQIARPFHLSPFHPHPLRIPLQSTSTPTNLLITRINPSQLYCLSTSQRIHRLSRNVEPRIRMIDRENINRDSIISQCPASAAVGIIVAGNDGCASDVWERGE